MAYSKNILIAALSALILMPIAASAQTSTYSVHSAPRKPSLLDQDQTPTKVIGPDGNVIPPVVTTPAPANTTAATPTDNNGQITEDAIRQLYKNSNDSYGWPFDQYFANLQKTMADGLVVEMTATVQAANLEPVTKSTKMDKATILKEARQTYDSMQNTERASNIVKIQISADRKTAMVQDQSMIKHAPFAPMLYMDGGGPCVDNLTLSATGDVQITQSTCSYQYTVTTSK